MRVDKRVCVVQAAIEGCDKAAPAPGNVSFTHSLSHLSQLVFGGNKAHPVEKACAYKSGLR